MILPTPQGAAWALFKRFWPAIPIIGLLIALAVVKSQNTALRAQVKAEQSAHLATKSNFRAAMAQAVADASENKRRVEAAQETARKESDERLETIRADYRRRTDAYVARMRQRGPVARNPGSTNLPGTPEAPKVPDGPDQDAFVLVSRPDLDALVENTAKLIEARNYYLQDSK